MIGSLLLGAPAASAMPAVLDPLASTAPVGAAAQLRCGAGVLGAYTDRRVRFQGFTNGRLDSSRVARGRLPRDVTGWGLYSSRQVADGNELTLAAVTSSGRPELVTFTSTKKALRLTGTRRLDQRSFSPSVFVDGYSFYAYTVSGGSLQRVRGVSTELLYAARADGSLVQVRVPAVRGEPRVRVLQLAETGYAGVTELSWGLCLRPRGTHTLIAVVPGEDRATWTTVEGAVSKPETTLQGAVEGGTGWSTLTAAY